VQLIFGDCRAVGGSYLIPVTASKHTDIATASIAFGATNICAARSKCLEQPTPKRRRLTTGLKVVLHNWKLYQSLDGLRSKPCVVRYPRFRMTRSCPASERGIASPTVIDEHIGARIRLRRMMLGLPMTQVAKELGISFQQLEKYERASPSYSLHGRDSLAGMVQTSGIT
jgi:hypothetical protein